MARLERHRGYLFGKLETIEKILIFIRIISLTQESLGLVGILLILLLMGSFD